MRNTSFQNQAVTGSSEGGGAPEQSRLAGLKSELGPVGLLLLVCVTGKLRPVVLKMLKSVKLWIFHSGAKTWDGGMADAVPGQPGEELAQMVAEMAATWRELVAASRAACRQLRGWQLSLGPGHRHHPHPQPSTAWE